MIKSTATKAAAHFTGLEANAAALIQMILADDRLYTSFRGWSTKEDFTCRAQPLLIIPMLSVDYTPLV